MIYVGIDIAKQNHYAAVQTDDGEVLIEAFCFTNDFDGFSLFLSKINGFDKENLVIGLESTAHYQENLVCFLFDLGYKVCVINPIQTSTLRKANIRKTKTDKVDTYLIIKSMIVNGYRLLTKSTISSLKLKTFCRFRKKLMKSKTSLKIQLVTFVDLLFPEFQYFFKSGIHGKACYALLKLHSAPDEIAALHLTYLSNLLRKHSRGHFKKEDALALKSLANSSVGTKNAVISIQITQCIEQIELLEKQISVLENIITETMKSTDSVIMSIPGIGFINGAMILGEIGDINRFSKPCQLLAFAGLDPVINQSGNFNAKKTKMSKRGSRLLRYALINAAWNVSLNDPTFKKYFDLKSSQGHLHYSALGHVAHKLVRVIFKLLTSNTAFNATEA